MSAQPVPMVPLDAAGILAAEADGTLPLRTALGRLLSLDSIRIDGGTQSRAEIDIATVNEYADALNNRAHFPPVVVYFDGKATWLSDGFHRYHAHRVAGRANIFAEICCGTVEEARFYASSANATHGKPRTAADKTHAIRLLLTTEKGKKMLARKGKHGSGLQAIAEHVGCAESFVRKVLENRTGADFRKEKKKPIVVETYLRENREATNAEVKAACGVGRNQVTEARKRLGLKAKPGVRAETIAPLLRAIEKWTEQQLDLLFAELRIRYPERFA